MVERRNNNTCNKFKCLLIKQHTSLAKTHRFGNCFPDAPCMDYLPTLGEKWPHSRGNVGKYSLHGASGFERNLILRKMSGPENMVKNIFVSHSHSHGCREEPFRMSTGTFESLVQTSELEYIFRQKLSIGK